MTVQGLRRRDAQRSWSWAVLVLALPAFVATWSGWVGLGELAGFGPVHPLPGIWDGLVIDTAITLPIGLETYAAFALGAWLSERDMSVTTRRFAQRSALGSLVLGMAGQIAFHVLSTQGWAAAPWWITTAVACLPVLVLGMGAGLFHLLRRDAEHAAAASGLANPSPWEFPARPASAPSPDLAALLGSTAAAIGPGDEPAAPESTSRAAENPAAATDPAGKSKAAVIVDRLSELGADWQAAAGDADAAARLRAMVPAAVEWAAEQGVPMERGRGYDAVRREIRRHRNGQPARLQVIAGGNQ